MKASEARERETQCVSKEAKELYDRVMESIETAVNRHKMDVNVGEYLTGEGSGGRVALLLKEEGYNVKATSDQREGNWTKISW